MILDNIILQTRKRIALLKKTLDTQQVRQQAQSLASGNDFVFYQALKKPGMRFICEVKKASPSKGVIDDAFDYVQIARDYQAAGADAISVLTEPDFFQGDFRHLQQIRQAVTLPILMKDFIIDSYQIYLAKSIGADAVLLICSILDGATLAGYLDLCRQLRLSALVETRNGEQVRQALSAGAKIIGVNNRNLETFEVDLETSLRLRKLVPPALPYIAESGIATREDVARLEQAGVSGALVGETLMRSPDKPKALAELRGKP